MRVGHGWAPLPVPEGTPLGGYADRPGGASGVLDELRVDCLVVDDSFALVVAEVVCVNEDLADEVRAAVGLEEVWVHATHTHSGPDLRCGPGGGETPAEWRSRIAAAAAEAAAGARAAAEECAAALHTGPLRDVGSPRGEADAPAAVTADAIVFTGPDGATRGVLAVVPVHPTVLPVSSTVVSGDLTAAIRRSLQAGLAAPWVVVATGAAGDISTRRTRNAQTPEECERLGALATAQLSELLATPATPLWAAAPASGAAPGALPGPPALAARRTTLPLPVREQPAAELAAARERIALAPPGDARTLATALQGLDIASARPDLGPELGLVLSAARLGELQLLGIGAEPFHSLAEDLRGPRPTVVLGYCNGHAGYLPDAAAYEHDGYEVLSSPFGPDAAARTVAALIDLLPDPDMETTDQ